MSSCVGGGAVPYSSQKMAAENKVPDGWSPGEGTGLTLETSFWLPVCLPPPSPPTHGGPADPNGSEGSLLQQHIITVITDELQKQYVSGTSLPSQKSPLINPIL